MDSATEAGLLSVNPNFKNKDRLDDRSMLLGRISTSMKRLVVIAAFTVFLSGCAIPLPVKIASWAIDGISYLATEKSIADHGLSMVTNKDCALWRPVKGEPICTENGDTPDASVAAIAGRKDQPIEVDPALALLNAGGVDEAFPPKPGRNGLVEPTP